MINLKRYNENGEIKLIMPPLRGVLLKQIQNGIS